jgi:transposase
LTITEKVTYKQDWPAYNEAQAFEKERFRILLADLCAGVPEPDRTGKCGQRPHAIKDAIFAMAYKVYCLFGSRRFSTDLREAHQRGYIRTAIPGVKVTACHENPEFTPILKQLIARSALPLRTVERDFAIDSSGFSSSRFERWFDHKYGVTRQKCVWVKVHLACGVKTNVVTAVRILDKDAADCPQFVPLVQETRQGFTISEVSADKAYASLENFEEVAAMGGQLFAAFKENATGGVGGMFEKMFHYFQLRREEFLRHYHKRSNVESTFSAIKRKFGDSVRSRTDTAMVNEVLCKVLCHNICCVIQEQVELGIEPVFWQDQEKAQLTAGSGAQRILAGRNASS